MAKPHRRQILGWVTGFAAIGMSPALADLLPASSAIASDVTILSAEAAHQAALAGDLILIDIRSPDEWRQTGVPSSSHPISMHVPGFLDKLGRLNEGDLSKPVALICARGNRSAFLKKELEKRGFSRVIDVSEGMVGGANGAGWIASGLPTRKVSTSNGE
ncbi:MAG: rhodanese-like domain-containing protein [Pseudomonadota bacterium]